MHVHAKKFLNMWLFNSMHDHLYFLVHFLQKNISTQWAKLPKKSLKKCIFDNSALKIQCHVVKNTFLQIAFSEILPTGIEGITEGCHIRMEISTKHTLLTFIQQPTVHLGSIYFWRWHWWCFHLVFGLYFVLLIFFWYSFFIVKQLLVL